MTRITFAKKYPVYTAARINRTESSLFIYWRNYCMSIHNCGDCAYSVGVKMQLEDGTWLRRHTLHGTPLLPDDQKMFVTDLVTYLLTIAPECFTIAP